MLANSLNVSAEKSSIDSQATWYLTEVSGDKPNNRRCYINSNVFRIGRSSESHLTIPKNSVSKLHAQLMLVEDKLILRDLGSTNGTSINGQSITESEVASNDLIAFADAVFRVNRTASEFTSCTLEGNVGNWANKLMEFDTLISGQGAVPFFQPIIMLDDRKVIGQELLARSTLDSLRNPAAMFEVAAALDQERSLSEMMRRLGCERASTFGLTDELYLNTHPKEISDQRLLDDLKQLRGRFPDASIVIEIHESAVTEIETMKSLQSFLVDLNMRLAYDDFGAGQARLLELSEIPPAILKFDMQLIRNIDSATSRHQAMISRLVQIVKELGIEPLAEGVETEGEHQVCCELGFVTGQGFLYGKPCALMSRDAKPRTA